MSVGCGVRAQGWAFFILFFLIGLSEGQALVFSRSRHIVPPGPSGYFSIERLIQLVNDKDITTVEQLLPLLPQDLRSRYVLMYRSRSLQKATFMEPRAILFEGDTSFIMSFNKENNIETIQYRPKERKWDFQEIIFRGGEKPLVSDVNPRKCLACHQGLNRTDIDPRPNWEPYNHWPGAYAGVDGETKSPFRSIRSFVDLLAPTDKQTPNDLEVEIPMLDRFLAEVKPTHPRYKYLGDFKARDILNFTDILLETNFYRVVRLATQTPDWDLYRDVFVDALFCNHPADWGDWEKRDVAALFLPPNLPQALIPIHKTRAAELAPQNQRNYYGRPKLADKIDILFDVRGIETSDWSTDFKSGGRLAQTDRFTTPNEAESQFEYVLLDSLGLTRETACSGARERLKKNEPAWSRVGRFAKVAADSEVRLREVAHSPGQKPLIERCISCHTSENSRAPKIPFDKPIELKAALSKTGYARGSLMDEIAFRLEDFADTETQMPPTGNTSPRSRIQLLKYLESLQ